jgi:hypothetical protein
VDCADDDDDNDAVGVDAEENNGDAVNAVSIICSSLVLILQYLDRPANNANRYMDDSVEEMKPWQI